MVTLQSFFDRVVFLVQFVLVCLFSCNQPCLKDRKEQDGQVCQWVNLSAVIRNAQGINYSPIQAVQLTLIITTQGAICLQKSKLNLWDSLVQDRIYWAALFWFIRALGRQCECLRMDYISGTNYIYHSWLAKTFIRDQCSNSGSNFSLLN